MDSNYNLHNLTYGIRGFNLGLPTHGIQVGSIENWQLLSEWRKFWQSPWRFFEKFLIARKKKSQKKVTIYLASVLPLKIQTFTEIPPEFGHKQFRHSGKVRSWNEIVENSIWNNRNGNNVSAQTPVNSAKKERAKKEAAKWIHAFEMWWPLKSSIFVVVVHLLSHYLLLTFRQYCAYFPIIAANRVVSYNYLKLSKCAGRCTGWVKRKWAKPSLPSRSTHCFIPCHLHGCELLFSLITDKCDCLYYCVWPLWN